MDANRTELERLAVEQTQLLIRIEAHASRANELLYSMLNREQRQSFDTQWPLRAPQTVLV